MKNKKNEIEYCKCEISKLISGGVGVDINCHYCGKEVEGMRKSFESVVNIKDYFEWEKGRFARKNVSSHWSPLISLFNINKRIL